MGLQRYPSKDIFNQTYLNTHVAALSICQKDTSNDQGKSFNVTVLKSTNTDSLPTLRISAAVFSFFSSLLLLLFSSLLFLSAIIMLPQRL